MVKLKRVFFSNHRFSIILIIISLVSYSVLLIMPVKAKQFGDGDFHEETKIFAAFVWGNAAYDELSITKAPGPILYYLIPYTVAGPHPTDTTLWKVSLAWTALLVTITLVALVKVIGNSFGQRVALIFSLSIFVLPLHVYYSMGVLAESLAFLGVCWVIIGYLSASTVGFNASFILGIVALVLARPNAGLVIPLLLVIATFLYWRKKDDVAKKILSAVVWAVVLIALVMVGVKSLLNKRATLKQEEYLSFVMHLGRFQFRTEPFDWRFWDNKTRADSKDYQAWRASTNQLNKIVKNNSLPYAKVYYDWVFKDMFSHPVVVSKQFFIRLLFGNTLQVSSRPAAEFGIMGIRGNAVYWIVHIALNLLNYAIVFFAVLLFINDRQNFYQFWPLVSVILALWIFHGIIYMEQRYLFPVRPILLLFAALGITNQLRSNRLCNNQKFQSLFRSIMKRRFFKS